MVDQVTTVFEAASYALLSVGYSDVQALSGPQHGHLVIVAVHASDRRALSDTPRVEADEGEPSEQHRIGQPVPHPFQHLDTRPARASRIEDQHPDPRFNDRPDPRHGHLDGRSVG